MITKFTVQGFKSIESTEIELGRVNVFIGANGCGKSNLLEALGVLAAAASGRVDVESLTRRGCRPGGIFRPRFKGYKGDGDTRLTAEAQGTSYQVELASPDPGRMLPWEFKREVWRSARKKIVDRAPNGKGGDQHAGLAALHLAVESPDTRASRFLKALAAYGIYAPDTPILRGLSRDPQLREPVGLSGGRLAEAVAELDKLKPMGSKLLGELFGAVGWFAGLGIMRLPQDEKNFRVHLGFLDRFFDNNRQEDGKRKWHLLSPTDVNEGVLYQLFLSVLCLHPAAPGLLAIDNGDHGLNPLLARHLVETMCKWLLEDERDRQVLMTTHNPLVLDGLTLQDDRVRLFTVDRDTRGTTVVNRFMITAKHQEMAAKGWTLSRMWVNKLIGGVPNV